MKYTNMFEKIIHIITMISSSSLYILAILLLLGLIFLLTRKKISKKICFLFSFLVTLLLSFSIIYTHHNVLSTTFNTLLDHLFTDLYFPSFYVYAFTFLFLNISILASFLNPHTRSSYKWVNAISLITYDFIFSMILNITASQKIDIFSKASLFSSKDLVIVLEFSISIFILWLLSLTILYITNTIVERFIVTSKEKVPAKEQAPILASEPIPSNIPKEITQPSYHSPSTTTEALKPKFIPTMESHLNKQLEIENAYQKMLENYQEVVVEEHPQTILSNSETLPKKTPIYEENTIQTTNNFDLSSFVPRHENTIIKPIEEKNNSSSLLDKILNNNLSYITAENTSITPEISKEDLPTSSEKDTYTLNDYRIFNKMLKDIKEHNQSNTITIDKNLEYRLITKYSDETYQLFKRMLKNYSN